MRRHDPPSFRHSNLNLALPPLHHSTFKLKRDAGVISSETNNLEPLRPRINLWRFAGQWQLPASKCKS